MEITEEQRQDLIHVSIEPNRLGELYADEDPSDFLKKAFHPELINLAKITASVVRNETLKGHGLISLSKLEKAANIYSKIGPLIKGEQQQQTAGALRITDNGKY